MCRVYAAILFASLALTGADRTGRVSGLVTDPSLAEIRWARVELRSVGEGVRSVLTACDGGFAFDGVEPGRYLLIAETPGFRELVREVIVKSGQEVRAGALVLDFDLRQATSLFGVPDEVAASDLVPQRPSPGRLRSNVKARR